MRRLKAILVVCVMASSLFAAAGTASARSDAVQRGTSWTDFGGAGMPVDIDPGGISWEVSPSF